MRVKQRVSDREVGGEGRGNLAMHASCERNRTSGKLSRVRLSQPLGSVMTGRREPDGKISECNEVKGVALNLTRSPENTEFGE